MQYSPILLFHIPFSFKYVLGWTFSGTWSIQRSFIESDIESLRREREREENGLYTIWKRANKRIEEPGSNWRRRAFVTRPIYSVENKAPPIYCDCSDLSTSVWLSCCRWELEITERPLSLKEQESASKLLHASSFANHQIGIRPTMRLSLTGINPAGEEGGDPLDQHEFLPLHMTLFLLALDISFAEVFRML